VFLEIRIGKHVPFPHRLLLTNSNKRLEKSVIIRLSVVDESTIMTPPQNAYFVNIDDLDDEKKLFLQNLDKDAVRAAGAAVFGGKEIINFSGMFEK
jgi:hypothetical protein